MEKSSPRFYNLSVKRKEKKMTTEERIITIRLLGRIKVDPVTAKRIIKKVRIAKGGKCRFSNNLLRKNSSYML